MVRVLRWHLGGCGTEPAEGMGCAMKRVQPRARMLMLVGSFTKPTGKAVTIEASNVLKNMKIA